VRLPLIAGNWKMNLKREEAETLAQKIAEGSRDITQAELAVCPPSLYLDAVGKKLCATQGARVALGAQNVYFEANGAFTGEISTQMLTGMGCKYVILGHSERRHILGETDQDVNRKTLAALQAGLVPIVCVGELRAEREAGRTAAVVGSQIAGSLAGLTADQMQRVVIAYEPVWAIGSDKPATPQQAEEVHADLRRLLASRYNAAVAETVRILYGGAVKPDNAASLLCQQNIDGALVGGASLKAESFFGIVAGVPGR
jgi:triosephosphate isomerase (TIM)